MMTKRDGKDTKETKDREGMPKFNVIQGHETYNTWPSEAKPSISDRVSQSFARLDPDRLL